MKDLCLLASYVKCKIVWHYLKKKIKVLLPLIDPVLLFSIQFLQIVIVFWLSFFIIVFFEIISMK